MLLIVFIVKFQLHLLYHLVFVGTGARKQLIIYRQSAHLKLL